MRVARLALALTLAASAPALLAPISLPSALVAGALAAEALAAEALAAAAQAAEPLAPRDEPAKSLPVPDTASPALQAVIAQPLRDGWNTPPTTPEGWTALNAKIEAAAGPQLAAMAERLHVKIQPDMIAGVKVYRVAPDDVPPAHTGRVLVHVHGGCYVLNPRLAALSEAVMMAGIARTPVIAVDYRMPPEAYFPAALDDAEAVYRAVVSETAPADVGVFGSSAGGALTLELMLRAKLHGLPMPGAIAPGTPMSDVTKRGDTFATNAMVDNVLVSPDGFCHAATLFYAHGHDLADPMLSPINGDLHGFPPAMLTTGTRDLLLSNTVRVQQKLHEAGTVADLQVFEGMSHAQYYRDDRIPEDRLAFDQISAFFDRHLGQ